MQYAWGNLRLCQINILIVIVEKFNKIQNTPPSMADLATHLLSYHTKPAGSRAPHRTPHHHATLLRTISHSIAHSLTGSHLQDSIGRHHSTSEISPREVY